jgi:Polymer-forming cytoskeletal
MELFGQRKRTINSTARVPRETCMPQQTGRTIFCILAISLLLAAPALGQQKSDRVQYNHDIILEPGQTSGDLECVNCSIFVRGEVTGDVTVVHGNAVLEHGAKVTGDVTTVLGDLRLQSGAQVQGDATVVGGTVRRAPEAIISGDVTSLGGAGWVVLIVFLPLAVIGGFVAFIVWLIARMRRPAPIAA